jgi:hypothetical protein
MARVINGGFYFVPVDDPAGRQSKKRPESQRYAKEARKHVMKDIGLSRRKEKGVKTSRSNRIQLELVDGVNTPASSGNRKAQLAHRPGRALHVYEQPSGLADSPEIGEDADEAREESTYPLTATEPISREYDFPSLAMRLGSGRIDPFARYPVEMGNRARYLLDTRKSTLAPPNLKICKRPYKHFVPHSFHTLWMFQRSMAFSHSMAFSLPLYVDSTSVS